MPSSRPTYRSTAMDRAFADGRIIAVTGPSLGLDPEATRATLTDAENSSPTPRLALEPRSDSRQWNYRRSLADTAVHHAPDADTADLGKLLTDIRNRSGTRGSLEVSICGDYLAVDFSHGLGDGQLGVMMMAAFSSDPDGSLAPGLAAGLPSRATWTALRRHYATRPSAVRDFWRLRGAHKRKPAQESLHTRTIENWTTAKVSKSGYMAPARVSELKKWATTEAEGATSASISVALWAAALRAENVAVDEHIMILFNSRRYLGPEYVGAHGNFAVGIPLHLPQSSTPGDIASTMRAVIDSGWPIAILAMSEIKAILRRSYAKVPDTAAVEVPRALRLAVSDLGKLPMFGHLKWAEDGRPPQLAASLEPDGPDGVTMLIAELGGGRTYTASYCSTFVDDAIIESALARLCTDPVGLLRAVRP
ncbi:hypothetical protein QMK17_20965 [Rhodococcus sp. G-MC3]|uniref:hypothetical protein n=1 Tax=Rhodococcus sp. G-MC3 TaxID=3046209 RepID=UPI0024BBC0FA|nr:hypothetical protein [Rhodococcus sp. G-MC3]MDJ0395796.1 hypothetical protein [Rhodococcus sp. G-MC3]